ncbi:hypothetical protein BSLG_004901 [Batrachochytrium salamandrivorans]|nr:hypothetical protein BSLG_004901 [Batrachochytrium salamandrivorans]
MASHVTSEETNLDMDILHGLDSTQIQMLQKRISRLATAIQVHMQRIELLEEIVRKQTMQTHVLSERHSKDSRGLQSDEPLRPVPIIIHQTVDVSNHISITHHHMETSQFSCFEKYDKNRLASQQPHSQIEPFSAVVSSSGSHSKYIQENPDCRIESPVHKARVSQTTKQREAVPDISLNTWSSLQSQQQKLSLSNEMGEIHITHKDRPPSISDHDTISKLPELPKNPMHKPDTQIQISQKEVSSLDTSPINRQEALSTTTLNEDSFDAILGRDAMPDIQRPSKILQLSLFVSPTVSSATISDREFKNKSPGSPISRLFRWFNFLRSVATAIYSVYTAARELQNPYMIQLGASGFWIATIVFVVLDVVVAALRAFPKTLWVFWDVNGWDPLEKSWSPWALIADHDLIIDVFPILANVILKVYGYRLAEIVANPLARDSISNSLVLLVLFGFTLFYTIMFHAFRLWRVITFSKKSPVLGMLVILKAVLLLFDVLTNALLLYQVLVFSGLDLLAAERHLQLMLAVAVPSPIVTLTTNTLLNLPLHFMVLRLQLRGRRDTVTGECALFIIMGVMLGFDPIAQVKSGAVPIGSSQHQAGWGGGHGGLLSGSNILLGMVWVNLVSNYMGNEATTEDPARLVLSRDPRIGSVDPSADVSSGMNVLAVTFVPSSVDTHAVASSPVNSSNRDGITNGITNGTTNGISPHAPSFIQRKCVALAANMGIKAVIVMPVATPPIKWKNVERLGAQVLLLHGNDFDAAKQECARLSKMARSASPPYDDPHVIAGQGTIGVEIFRQYDYTKIDAIFICIGGGGLAAMELQCNGGEETFRICRSLIDEMVLVSTDEICAAIKDVFEDTRGIVEPSGALGLLLVLRSISRRRASQVPHERIFRLSFPERPGALYNFLDTIRHPQWNISLFHYGTTGRCG